MAAGRLKISDAAWLFADGRRTPQQVGILLTCSLPPGAPDGFLRELVARWRSVSRFAPPFNYQLTGGLWPSWRPLPNSAIDIDYHLRHSALPAPGGERELGVLVSRLHSQQLDRHYPLWEAHVIEGLEHGRFAVYMKMHHSQMDGVGGIRLLRQVMSTDPERRDLPPPWAVEVRRPDREPVTGQPAGVELSGLRAVAGALARTTAESLLGTGDPAAAPYRAPKTIFNGRIQGPRRFATQHYDLERIKRIARAAQVTVNDVFLAVCSGAVRRYLDELDALPEQTLTALLPVSVRPEGDLSVGNRISFGYAKLGTHLSDPVRRLRLIRSSTAAAKARLQTLPGSAMTAYTVLLMGPYLGQNVAGLGGYGSPNANLVISNVPGPDMPLYLNGARIEEIYPASLLFNGQALNITVVSYAGRFNVGYTGDRDSMPHMQRLAVYSGAALSELESAVLGQQTGVVQPSS